MERVVCPGMKLGLLVKRIRVTKAWRFLRLLLKKTASRYMVGANVLNKSLGQLTSSDLSAWGLVEGLTLINQHLTKCSIGTRLWTDSLKRSQQ